MLKIQLSSNKELIKEINQKLKQNHEQYGDFYCPCALIHNEDTICQCKEFREQDYPGSCHCGKFEKIEVEE